MKLSFRIFQILIKWTIMLLIILLSACEQAYVEPYENFELLQGKHARLTPTQTLQSSQLLFTAIFDETAIYETKTKENQHDINKLLGFSDCNSHHHENSARFGWRWLDGALEIHAYVYANGERTTEYVGTVELNKPTNYQLSILPDSYLFSMEGFDQVRIQRNATCDKGLYYMLFPYFGGDEPAPHDINIKIKINY